jgi:hypothetical protein
MELLRQSLSREPTRHVPLVTDMDPGSSGMRGRRCGGGDSGAGPSGALVTRAVRSPMRPATRGIRVVSMASTRVIAGRMVVSRLASIDVPIAVGQAY